MTYNPYPQQPDPNYGYQQQYQPYQQTYPQQQYPAYGPPPPQKKSRGPLVILIVVVVVIVFIGLSVILAGVLMVYMQGFSSGPGTTAPIIAMSPLTFTNPYDGDGTSNGGGWTVRIISVGGTRPSLTSVTATIALNTIPYAQMKSISSTNAKLSYTAGAPQWYLESNGASFKFMDGTTAKTLDSSTAKNLGGSEFDTVQGARFIYVDVDGDGLVSVGDFIKVYASNNGDLTPDITGNGYTFELSMTGQKMGSSSLV